MLDDIQEWKRSDLAENRPVPLVIEVYLDTTSLVPGQALVIKDEDGKRYDVADVLDAGRQYTSTTSSVQEVVLERWTVQLGDAEGYTSAQLNDQLPNVYKKGVVLFRSLYTFARLLPVWKLHRRLTRQTGTNNPLRLKLRVRKGPNSRASARSVKEIPFVPLCPSDTAEDSVGSHNFDSLFCPAGPLSVTVQYRIHCDFSVADSEALLSSRFAGLDAALQDRMTGQSLPGNRSQTGEISYGSANVRRSGGKVAGGGAYGSLGTYHAAGKRESPVSVLRQRALSQEEEEEEEDDDDDDDAAVSRGNKLVRRRSQVGESDLLRNPPFKAGSYASSPRIPGSPSSSLPRVSPFGTSAPKRLSVNALTQQSLRAPSEHAIASSGSASPKPAPVHRYSSSFANRKRFTSQSSRAGESATSSGQGSSSSKDRSGQLGEGNAGSSGSGRTDEDDIAAFIVSVERAKDLTAFSSARKSPGSNTINLTKYKGMGIANSELADEMSSSSLIQTSLTPPSRRLSNVPGLSTSSSPGRALAHAPHVRSRLSTHSIIEEKEGPGASDNAQGDGANDDDSSDEEPFIFQQDIT